MLCVQEELPLFERPPSFEDLLSQRNINDVIVEIRSRLRTNWYVTADRKTGMRKLSLPTPLETAPTEVKNALIDWARLPWAPRKKRHKELSDEKKRLETVVWAYMAQAGSTRSRRRVDALKLALSTRGTVYDLAEIARSINEQFFGGEVETLMRWGSYASTTSYQTYVRDLENKRVSMITIAGVYNHPKVPRFAIEAVVYHEMLHVVVPTYKKNGRNIYHGPEFKRRERQFPSFRAWRVWEQENLRSLLRSLKIRARKRRGK